MKRILIVLFVLIMMSGCMKEEEVKGNVRILCYGDSNTYGYNPYDSGRYEEDRIWTSILNDRLGNGYDVINAGMNGRTTAYDIADSFLVNGLSSLDECLKENMPLDMVVFMLGTNDCNRILHLSKEAICEGMERLVKTATDKTREYQGYSSKILIVVPGAIRDNLDDSIFRNDFDEESIRKSKEIAPLYRDLAERYDCLYLDASDKVDVVDFDCIHLSENGHRQLSELVYEIIVSEYE